MTTLGVYRDPARALGVSNAWSWRPRAVQPGSKVSGERQIPEEVLNLPLMPCKLVSPELPLGLSWVLNEEFDLERPQVEEGGPRNTAKEQGCTNPVQPRLTPTGSLVTP